MGFFYNWYVPLTTITHFLHSPSPASGNHQSVLYMTFCFLDSHVRSYGTSYFPQHYALKVYVDTNCKISLFLWLCTHTHRPTTSYPFIHQWTLRLLHVLVIINNAVNFGVHMSFDLIFSFPLDKYPEMEFLDHKVVLLLIF